jgi:DNA-binding response OmpR family regulator
MDPAEPLRLTDRVEVEGYVAHVGDRSVPLWIREGRILAYLLAHPQTACRYRTLRQACDIRSNDGLKVSVGLLRRKLGDVPGMEIQAVRGVGYRLEVA